MNIEWNRIPVVMFLGLVLATAGLACREHDRKNAPTLRTDSVPVEAAVKNFNELIQLPQERLEQREVAAMNLLSAQGLPGAETLDAPACLDTLDQWAARVRSETERHRYRFRADPAEFDNSEGYFRMLMMAVVVAEDFGVRYNRERLSSSDSPQSDDAFFRDSRDVFLHGVLGPRRMGTCSSMPVLYVALGRRLGYPVKLVTTKGHLFVRWESETEHLNLEATGRGMNHYDDEQYTQWPFPLTEEEIRAHGYLKSLSAAEELAVFLAIRGQCLREAGRLAEAVESFEHASRLAPGTLGYRLLLAEAQARTQGATRASALPLAPAARYGENAQIPIPSASLPSPVGPDPNPLLQIR